MGLFNALIGAKYCNICGKPVNLLTNKKLRNGTCCGDCISKLSPFFTARNQSSVADITYQLSCREKNLQKLHTFSPSRILGNGTKVFYDDSKHQFLINSSHNYKAGSPDVIDCTSITNCIINIQESKKEIQYEDSNGNIKSFNPPTYAHSFDFYVDISVSIPYINHIQIKINNSPVDNGQETLIRMEGGLLTKFADKFINSNRSYGATSNASEVRASSYYISCDQIARDIRDTLLNGRTLMQEQVRIQKAVSEAQKLPTTPPPVQKIVCPWCDSLVIPDNSGLCINCCGRLNR